MIANEKKVKQKWIGLQDEKQYTFNQCYPKQQKITNVHTKQSNWSTYNLFYQIFF